ncbi:hypothetical protein BJ170DRAFT_110092 [Xylariales sp. AK1849]|nr:hypothetical protein BJ170DRAFT_110092 [Xylariales sp. AK1849]
MPIKILKMVDIREALPSTCDVVIPSKDSKPIDVLSNRWSECSLSLPYATITPSTEADVIAAIHFASKNGLRLVPSSGGHAPYVPVSGETLYMDMRKFSSVNLGKEGKIVTLGGGTLTGDVVKGLAAEGYWTLMPSSNAVGVVGAVLGGGFSPFSATGKGLAIDQLLSIRVITASGEVITASAQTEPELFGALCGGGYGLGVATELTLRVFSGEEAGLDDGNKIVSYSAMVPQPEFASAIEMFGKFAPPPRNTQIFLVFTRAPKQMPIAGAPVAVLMITYVGPKSDAQEALAPVLAADFTKKCIYHRMHSVELAHINAMDEAHNKKGGYKEMYNSLQKSLPVECILGVAEDWVKFIQDHGGEGDVLAPAFISWDPTCLSQHDKEGKKAFVYRQRGIMTQMNLEYVDQEFGKKGREFSLKALKNIRTEDSKNGLPAATIASNLYKGIEIENAYGTDKLSHLREMKRQWDPEGVFWSPTVHVI